MRQTLFVIPDSIAGWPVFGVGLLLALWAVISLVVLAVVVRRHGWGPTASGLIVPILVSGGVIYFLLPRLATDGGIPIRGYGVLLLLAVVSGVALSVRRGQRRGFLPDTIFSLAFWMFLAGIGGARAFYVIEYWDRFQRGNLRDTLTAMLNITQGGLVVYGSLIGGGIAAIVFTLRHRLPPLRLADAIVPGMVLGLAIGRVGCFLNGCCYGGACDLPWAVTFPQNSPPYLNQAERGTLAIHGVGLPQDSSAPPTIESVTPGSPAERAGLEVGQTLLTVNTRVVRTAGEARQALVALDEPGRELSLQTLDTPAITKQTVLESPLGRSLPIHPAQIYSAIDAALLCLFLLAYDPFARRDGELLAWMLTLHPISRYLLEVIRVDEGAVFGTDMSISQNLSILLLVGGIALWLYIFNQQRRRPLTGHLVPAA